MIATTTIKHTLVAALRLVALAMLCATDSMATGAVPPPTLSTR